MMPRMDGFELAAELKRREDWRGIPVVVLTAKDLTNEDRKRLNGNVERVISKSAYPREELVREIREVLVRSTSRRRAE